MGKQRPQTIEERRIRRQQDREAQMTAPQLAAWKSRLASKADSDAAFQQRQLARQQANIEAVQGRAAAKAAEEAARIEKGRASQARWKEFLNRDPAVPKMAPPPAPAAPRTIPTIPATPAPATTPRRKPATPSLSPPQNQSLARLKRKLKRPNRIA